MLQIHAAVAARVREEIGERKMRKEYATARVGRYMLCSSLRMRPSR
jgi:hypothetical protein